MEICILGFKGSDAADEAYDEVLELRGEDNRWLLEVATITRPLVGRVRVGATFPDGETIMLHEGDLAHAAADLGGLTGYYISALAGPFASIFAAAEVESAALSLSSEAERRLFHLDDIKKALPRDSSALALIADDEICDALVKMFDPYSPEVMRLGVEPELRTRLEAFERRLQRVEHDEGLPMGL
jgi:hypothetical protein